MKEKEEQGPEQRLRQKTPESAKTKEGSPSVPKECSAVPEATRIVPSAKRLWWMACCATEALSGSKPSFSQLRGQLAVTARLSPLPGMTLFRKEQDHPSWILPVQRQPKDNNWPTWLSPSPANGTPLQGHPAQETPVGLSWEPPWNRVAVQLLPCRVPPPVHAHRCRVWVPSPGKLRLVVCFPETWPNTDVEFIPRD